MSEIDLSPEHRLELVRQQLDSLIQEHEKIKSLVKEIQEYVADASNSSIFYVRSLLRRYGFE